MNVSPHSFATPSPRMNSVSIFSAASIALLLLGSPSILSAQGTNTTTESSAITSPGGTSLPPDAGVPATSTAPKHPTGDVSRLRRLVRDVATNTDNVRSSGNFGAQLWLTADGDFFQNWRKPQTPEIDPVRIALRGQPIYTIIIFYGEATTPAGLGNVTYDITALRPDGSIYNRRDALIGFQNLAPTDNRELQLGRNYLNVNIGPDDPAGLYTVNVTIHDNVSQVSLPLKQTFVVE